MSILFTPEDYFEIVVNDVAVQSGHQVECFDTNVLVEGYKESNEDSFGDQQHHLMAELVEQLAHERVGLLADACAQRVVRGGYVRQLEGDQKVEHGVELV